jgi:Mlc titration factor MtfA (ptsG expression regulator)
MSGLLGKLTRWQLARRPIPEKWLTILEGNVPFYPRISGAMRQRFLEMLKIFVWEKYFIGAGGMVITDEVRVVISACAVRLVLHLDLSYYDRLSEIVVYPYVYKHLDEEVAVLGEARNWGTVVLSWPAVLQGLASPKSGHETATHEFAHVLDRADGVFDGTPKLRARADYRPWAEIMSRHYLGLQKGGPIEGRVLRQYGATNEAEFFAVATESYFERPQLMKKLIPDLYAELQAFYGGDPASLESRYSGSESSDNQHFQPSGPNGENGKL